MATMKVGDGVFLKLIKHVLSELNLKTITVEPEQTLQTIPTRK